MPDLSADEFREILAEDSASLGADLRAMYEPHAVSPIRMVHVVSDDESRLELPVWVIAKDGLVVLGYDEAEESYGTGVVRTQELAPGGVVEDWGTFDDLRWAIRPFARLAGRVS